MNIETLDSSPIVRLQEWYNFQCDGDWEHSYGVKIDTLDNPGWIVSIDLVDTELEDVSIELQRTVRSENDWVQYQIENKQYIACGGPFSLEELIRLFLEIVDH